MLTKGSERMAFREKLKMARLEKGLTQQEVADLLGVVKSTYSKYESGDREPDVPKIKKLAEILNIAADELLETDVCVKGLMPMPVMKSVARLGTIACGTPILAEQNLEGYDEVPDFVHCDFSLVCRGDSMKNARINDGDIVFIKQQPTVENGQIAAVLVGDEATLKRVQFLDNGVALMPENSAYAPMVFTGEEANNVKILGLATHFISKII